MSIDLWLALVVASAALLAMPGPVVLLLLGHVLARGRSVAWGAVPGVVLGDFVAMSVSLLGAGAVLAASATLFTIMKLSGAAYLVWLGIGVLIQGPTTIHVDARGGFSAGRRAAFVQALFVTMLNPKDIVFFIAFLPQFIDTSAPMLPQLVVIEMTFLAMVATSTTLWILLGAQLSERLRDVGALRWVNRVGGGCLIGAGAFTAVARRGS